MERRDFTAIVGKPEFREADGKRTIAGTAAVFWNGSPNTQYELWAGGPVERIMPGTFARAIQEDDVRALVNHDPNLLLGRKSAGTLRLMETPIGLQYEIDVADTQAARDTAVSLQRGDMSGSSFSFEITDEVWEKAGGLKIRNVKGVRLFDVGPVTFPAYTSTTAGMRCDDPKDVLDAMERWEAEQARQLTERVGKMKAAYARARVAGF